jgi:hypothetical protein
MAVSVAGRYPGGDYSTISAWRTRFIDRRHEPVIGRCVGERRVHVGGGFFQRRPIQIRMTRPGQNKVAHGRAVARDRHWAIAEINPRRARQAALNL